MVVHLDCAPRMRDEIPGQEIIVRAGDMAQSIKCLLKHETVSSGPITPIKSQDVAVYTCNPRTEREWVTMGSLGLTTQPSSSISHLQDQ